MPELQSTILRDKTELVGYWKLEDVNDSSASGYNLTNNNTSTFTAGKFNNAVTLNGSNQSLSIANASCPNLNITGSQTWCCWFNTNVNNADKAILLKHDGTNYRLIQISPTGNIIGYLSGLTTNSSITSDVTVSNGVWYFIAMVYNSVTQKLGLWVNDKYKEVSASGATTSNSGNFYIGSDRNTQWYFNGKIDDAAIFNTALSADQIKELYEGRFLGEGWPQAGLVAGYHLSDTTDFSGNNYHLTNTGTVTFPAGRFGNCADFGNPNTTKKLGTTALGISGDSSLTVSMWFNITALPSTGTLISTFNHFPNGKYIRNYLLNTTGTYTLVLDCAGTTGTYTFPSTPTLGVWYYYVLVRNGTTSGTQYLNGNQISTSGAGTGTTAGNTFYIGNYDGTSGLWTGKIDEVQIYNVAKDARWVRQQFAWGSGKFL